MGEFNMRKFAPLNSDSSSLESSVSFQSDTSLFHPAVDVDVESQEPDSSCGRSILTFMALDKIKRRAHREAWGDSTNPFARGPKRASTYTEGGVVDRDDVEANAGLSPIGDDHLRRLSSEPARGSNVNLDRGVEDVISPSTMTGATAIDEKRDAEGRLANGEGQSSEETAVDRSVHEEGLKKRKFLGIFPRKPKEDEQELSHHNTGLSTRSKSKKSIRHQPFTWKNQIKNTLFNSWINILLLAAPVGIALHFTSVKPVAVFVVNFVAIIPLAALLSYATEEIALRVGETLGGLLNATFGFVHTNCKRITANFF